MTFQCFIGLNIRQNITHKYPGQDVNQSIHTCKGSFSYFILLCVTKYIDKEGGYKILPKKLFWTKILDKKFRFVTTLNFGNSLKKTAPLTLNLIPPPFIYRHYLTARYYCVATLEVSYVFYHSTAQMTDSFNYIQNTSFVPSALMT